MPAKLLPADALEALRQRLHTLPPRSPERHQMIHATAATYGVSDTTVYRALQARTSLRVVHRVDRGSSRVLPRDQLERYCELIAAMNSGFTNLSSIAYSDLGCWVYEKTKPSPPRSEH